MGKSTSQEKPGSNYIVTAQPRTTTVVIASQPVSNQSCPKQLQQRDWSTGLFDCFDDIGVCLMASFLPQCYVAYLATRMGESCYMPFYVLMPLVPMRAVIRERHDIKGSIFGDCICVSVCGPCVVCQLARELKATGYWR